MKGNNGWEAYRRLREAGLPVTTTKAAGVKDTTEKVARSAYLDMPAHDKALVDSWRDLGNSWFDSVLNSGVLTRTRSTTQKAQSIRVSPGRADREIFTELPWQQKDVVREWLATGCDLRSAILNSNVLGTGEPLTPSEARQHQLHVNEKRHAAEHEAAHAVAAAALGLEVKFAKIDDDNSGSCVHVKGTKLENAIVIMAGEIWISSRRDAFPYGPTGLKADHRDLAEISDVFILRQAMSHCTALLSRNRTFVLALSDQIEKYGSVVAPWL